VSQDTLRQLVSASILSRLDYCNSLLYMDCRGRLSLHSSACRMPLRGSFWACRHVTTSVLHSRHYTSCPFITGFSSRSRCSCTMHSLAGVQSTLSTSLHLLPVTPVVEPSPAVGSVSRYCQTVQTITENPLLPVAFLFYLTVLLQFLT